MGEALPDEFYENIYKLKGWQWRAWERTAIALLGTTRAILWMNV